MAAVLAEDGLTTSAIEGERFAPDVLRSSVARHLGLPTAGPPEAGAERLLAALESAQRGDLDATDWLGFFLAQVEAAATAAEGAIATTLAKVRFWVRHQATDVGPRQRKVLNRLLDAGPAGFEGGMNTRKYASLTRTSRATAYRELADLVAKGCLRPTGRGGRSAGYEIVW